MKMTITAFGVLAVVAGFVREGHAHCEVPCGIYDDERRFEMMLEDCDTIAKAIDAMHEYVAGEIDPNVVNQMVRWTNTKETHATNTQHIVSQYFLTQRIKPGSQRYVPQLKAAHAVLVAAMKCKQSSDPATAKSLRNSILNLYRAYEGKEPKFEKK